MRPRTFEDSAKGFEDLQVFKKAYRLSLEVHRASLEFPVIEQRVLADQIRRASKSICANLAEGVQTVRVDGPGLGRRDAGVAALCPGSRLCRREDLGGVARRLSGSRADAARSAPVDRPSTL